MEDQIYITIAKVLHDEASDRERAELDSWLRADATHAGIFAEMKATWQTTEDLLQTPHFDAVPAWQKVSAKIHQPIAALPGRRSKIVAFPAWLKYSSAVAAILIIGMVIWNPFSSNTIRVAALDGNKIIELPDHSIITLRKGAAIRYPKAFAAAERKVSLEGEAFFEVTRNEQQPFVIDAQSVSVRVLGTTFNVQCSDKAADVTVVTGRVQVTAAAGGGKVILTPGTSGHYQEGQLSQGPAVGNESSWQSGTLTFSNTPFLQVAAALAAAKDTVVQLDPAMPALLQQQAVTVSFRNQPLEDMLTELCLITNCRWQKESATYIIRTK